MFKRIREKVETTSFYSLAQEPIPQLCSMQPGVDPGVDPSIACYSWVAHCEMVPQSLL